MDASVSSPIVFRLIESIEATIMQRKHDGRPFNCICWREAIEIDHAGVISFPFGSSQCDRFERSVSEVSSSNFDTTVFVNSKEALSSSL